MKSCDNYIRVSFTICMVALIILLFEVFDALQYVTYSHAPDKRMDDLQVEEAFDETQKMRDEDINAFVQKSYVIKNISETHLKPRNFEIQYVDKIRLFISDADKEILYRIVQAEAGGEDQLGKKMVTNVIMNRVLDQRFPNTIKDVVFQKSQFAPTRDGRYERVVISEDTKKAVEEATLESDPTNGALYFVATSKAAKDKVTWFENKLQKLMIHGGHTFYK